MFIFAPDRVSNGTSAKVEQIHHRIPVSLKKKKKKKGQTAYAQRSKCDISALGFLTLLPSKKPKYVQRPVVSLIHCLFLMTPETDSVCLVSFAV